MIEDFFLQTLNEMDVEDVWVQQDFAKAHISHVSMTPPLLEIPYEQHSQAISNIIVDMMERFEPNFRIRSTQCIGNNGRLISYLKLREVDIVQRNKCTSVLPFLLLNFEISKLLYPTLYFIAFRFWSIFSS